LYNFKHIKQLIFIDILVAIMLNFATVKLISLFLLWA